MTADLFDQVDIQFGKMFQAGKPKTGAELRDEGMATAISHADAVTPSWSENANAIFEEFLSFQSKDSDFMPDDVRDFAHSTKGLPLPPDSRAWGGIFMGAARSKRIVRVGYAPSRDPKSHKCPTSVWRKI